MSENLKDLKFYEKAMIKNKHNWKVIKKPLYDESGNKLRFEGTFRSDNNYPIGIVTPGYQVIDNIELYRYSEQLIANGENVEIAGGGMLDGGEGIFVQFKLPHKIDVKRVGDIVETELVVSTKHNGKGSVVSSVNSKRLVCENGAMTSAQKHVEYVRHNSTAEIRLSEARKAVVYIGQQVKQFGNLCNALADVQLTIDDINQIIEQFYYVDDKSNIHTSAHKQNQARAILTTYQVNDGDVFKSQRGTAWNMLNAFTNFADHQMNYRTANNESEEESKIRGKLFGVGQSLKFRALQTIATVIHKNHSINLPQEFLL